MGDDGRLDDETRRGLRILAASTKTANDKAARRLSRAADSGQRTDYLEAEAMFNALPAEGRRQINSTASERAKSIRARLSQKMQTTAAVDVPEAGRLTWQLGNIPGNAKAPAAGGAARTASGPKNDKPGRSPAASVDWALGQMPGAAKRPAGKTAADEDPDEGKTWDWQRVPEDPVTAARRRKQEPKNEFEELRRQMLGPLEDV